MIELMRDKSFMASLAFANRDIRQAEGWLLAMLSVIAYADDKFITAKIAEKGVWS